MTTSTTAKFDPTPLDEMPTGLPFHAGETNRRLLRAAWRVAALTPHYPIDSRSAIALLRLMGYDACPETLAHHVHRGYAELPPSDAWTEAQIIDLADAFESTRSWDPSSDIHRHKWTDAERKRFGDLRETIDAFIDSCRDRSLHDLLQMMAFAQGRRVRQVLHSLITARLGSIHVRGTDDVPEHDPREAN